MMWMHFAEHGGVPAVPMNKFIQTKGEEKCVWPSILRQKIRIGKSAVHGPV